MDPATVFATLATLGGTAPRTIVVGCEVENTDEGMGLSEPVAAAVPGAVAAVKRVLLDLTARTTSPAEG
jgi:hydrogenase maturation protease